MTTTEKEGGMNSARTHHTIGTTSPGGAASPTPVKDEPAAAPLERTPAAGGAPAAGHINPGFQMEQPRELAPRAAPAAALSAEAPAAAPGVAEGGTPVPGSALSREQLEQMTNDIIGALKTVYDPEIPSDIYELGLIYKIDIKDNRDVEIEMTLTAPACPVAGEMPQWVENAVNSVAGVGGVKVNLVFDPPWEMSRMSDEARLALNMF